MLPVPEEEEEDRRRGAELLGSFTGAARRPERRRRALTRPGVGRRGWRRTAELLDVEQTIGATLRDSEDRVVLLEVLRTSGDRRSGVLQAGAVVCFLSSPEKKGDGGGGSVQEGPEP